jgi:hypothetical protein
MNRALVDRVRETQRALREARQAGAAAEEIAHLMDDFAQGRIDPIEATRQMRTLTGGKAMLQVANDAQQLMASAGR